MKSIAFISYRKQGFLLEDKNLNLIIGGCLSLAFYNVIKNVFDSSLKNYLKSFEQELQLVNDKMIESQKYNTQEIF